MLHNSEKDFIKRHIGLKKKDEKKILSEIGYKSLDELISNTVPKNILLKDQLSIGEPNSEYEALRKLRLISKKNQIFSNFIGMGYYGTYTPNVVVRNIFENPGWYTSYTPYQPEVAQGRLEMLLNFQQMITDFTGMDIANASLLDEGTAAAEAMGLSHRLNNKDSKIVFVSKDCHPQTINIIQTRAEPMGLKVVIGNDDELNKITGNLVCGILQYPGTLGDIKDPSENISKIHKKNGKAILACDLLALAKLKTPGELGADIAVGSSQRFGIPMGYGGPHAAFFATKDEYKRSMPGRIIGVSVDRNGNKAYRLSLQTREQHIRRDRATSNICTAQVLLAIMSSMYAVYHGPKQLEQISKRVNYLTDTLATSLTEGGYELYSKHFFDTIRVKCDSGSIISKAQSSKLNFWDYGDSVGISLDETVNIRDIESIASIFGVNISSASKACIPESLIRKSSFLDNPVFNTYHSETDMLRYIHKLESKDLSLNFSMIPLGSCTMKLNSVTEMEAVTWPAFSNIHPYAPQTQVQGYLDLFDDLENWLCEITGFSKISLQPNAGSQGEYAGMLAIRDYHHSRGDPHRNVCLIPTSAHGTNPASAVMVGMKVVGVNCDSHGNIDVSDLKQKADEYSSDLAAAMITYPSTHGVFESEIKEVCNIIHSNGGQVYMDGANMNAMVGLCKPGEIGADVCHLNLHKTFCIPHGGGGPGMGPIGVASHLSDFLPSDPLDSYKSKGSTGPVSATNWGSSSILPISWAYIAMMGSEGLIRATQVAILNANYVAKKLSENYTVLYKGISGFVAHECILDTRELLAEADLVVDDIAKRLMDFGFHAPTMSWPVANTLMIEPTESESKQELDRFCESMAAIRSEINDVLNGVFEGYDNPLRGAPHTSLEVSSDDWTHSYTRQKAAYPVNWLKENKFWPSVGRVDNTYGDRNLICSCLDVETYSEVKK